MRFSGLYSFFCCLVLLSSCSKETFPKDIDWITSPENPIHVLDDSYSVVTDDGVLVVMDRDDNINFMDLENQSTLGQFFFTMKLPGHESPVFFSSMFYFDNKLWFMGTDTLYVYPSKPTSSKSLRKIVFENIYKPKQFTLNSTTLYSTGLLTPDGIAFPFKADLSDLWNPIYENSVFLATTESHQGLPYESVIPRFVHNGSVFSKSVYGITILDANTLDVTNYINVTDCNFELVGDYLFLTGGAYIHIYDVSDPLNPKLLDLKFHTCLHMSIAKDLTKWYVSNGDRIRVFDITDPSNIKLEKIYSYKDVIYNYPLGSMEVHKDMVILSSAVSSYKKMFIGRLK